MIAAFDAANYLDQALASVAGQTRPPDAVVIGDDRSTDDTAKRARRWSGRLPIEVVTLDRNRGPGPARHAAIEATDAELLALLDADDLWLPDHLETMAATGERQPGLVSARELSWIPGRGIDVASRRARPTAVPSSRAAQLDALLQHNYLNFPMFTRAMYERAGGFRERFRVGEDWDLWIRMLRDGASVSEASHPTAIHRVRPGSLSIDRRRTVDFGIDVLSAAVEEAASEAEREAAERGLRALRARASYHQALELAERGDAWRARRAAASTLAAGDAGAWKIRAGLAALAVAPTASVRLERRTRRYRVFHPD